jgi:HEAT repeat protein
LVRIGERSVPSLIRGLATGKQEVQARAAIALGRIGPAAGSAVPSLARLLSDKDDFVRLQSASALGRIGVHNTEVLCDSVLAALDERDYLMAESLLIALRETGVNSDEINATFAIAHSRADDRGRKAAIAGLQKNYGTASVRESKRSITIRLSGGAAAILVAGFDRK